MFSRIARLSVFGRAGPQIPNPAAVLSQISVAASSLAGLVAPPPIHSRIQSGLGLLHRFSTAAAEGASAAASAASAAGAQGGGAGAFAQHPFGQNQSRKGSTDQHQEQNDIDEETKLAEEILRASLKYVPEHGFSLEALGAACDELKISRGAVQLVTKGVTADEEARSTNAATELVHCFIGKHEQLFLLLLLFCFASWSYRGSTIFNTYFFFLTSPLCLLTASHIGIFVYRNIRQSVPRGTCAHGYGPARACGTVKNQRASASADDRARD